MERDWQDYKALYGNVAGARSAFEKTCRRLFKAKFHPRNVQTIRVKQGDGGIDVFVGDLGEEPISVFQCKFFIEDFSDSQKAQIKKSFETAINSKKYKMLDWNLCIPRELDIDSQAWWTKWKTSMETQYKIPIKLYNGDDLIDELKAYKLYDEEFKMEDKLQLDRIEKAVTAKIEKKKTLLEQLYTDVKEWFIAIRYTFEGFEEIDGSSFQIIINTEARKGRGFDRIYILGTCDEIELHHLETIKTARESQKCMEGWLITYSRISSAVKREIAKNPNEIFCYTLDELIDERVDFTEYFEWVKKEVSDKGIDKKYIQLACKKDSINPQTKVKMGHPSIYDEKNGFIEGYLDKWLDDPNKKHISVLGEFGTGKTWFSLHYTWYLLKKYLDNKSKGVKLCRLPIYIPLRDYAKAATLESLFSDFFFRKYNSPIPGYKAFEMLNRMGKILIVFDGFDEMADKVDKQKMVNNFWQLAKIASIDNTKVILTSRNEHFPQSNEGHSILNAELPASVTNLTGESPQFEVVELLKLNLKQIKKILSFNTNPDIIEKIIKNKALLDLAARPLMIELIVDAIPDIENGKDIDLSRVYLYAVSKKMRKDIKEERTFTSMAEKLFFMCEISWEMLSNEKMSINYKEFPDRIRNLFGRVVQEQKDLDHWQYDMMGQTLLIRNDDGDYKPAHRSLLEFFVAYKFAAELGVLSEDFIEIARENKNVNQKIQPQNYTWQEYFTLASQKESIAPLKNFSNSPMSVIIENFGKIPLSKAVLDLILNIIPLSEDNIQNSLLNLLAYCRNKKREEINYLSNNIILLLVSFKFDFFRGRDLSNLIISNYNFPKTPATERDGSRQFYDIQDNFADFSNCNFEYSDLRECDFGNPVYSWSKRETGSNVLNANFKNTQLDGFSFSTAQVDSFTINPKNQEILVGSGVDGIVIMDKHFNLIKRVHTFHAWNIIISPNNKYLICSGHGRVFIMNTENYELIREFEFSKQVNPKSDEKDNLWTGGFKFTSDSKILFAACNNSFVYIININEEKEISHLECFRSVSDISLSPNNKYLLSYGFDEFILWDWEARKKIYFEKETKKGKLVFYSAKFHPVRNTLFVLCRENRVEVFDTETLSIKSDFYFNKAEHICFVEQRDLMLISNGKDIGIYEFSTLKEIEKFEISIDLANKFQSFKDKLHFYSFDDLSTQIINNRIFLFFNFKSGIVIKYDLEDKKVVNSYLNMIDFSGSDFTGAKGLTKEMAEQLKKNGAIIDVEAYKD
jgi:uncharacterized protein YjbI with pentapeptide repeats